MSMMEGVCPDCSGAVTGSLHRCDDHDTHGETVCEHCGGLLEIQSLFVCEVCQNAWGSSGWAPIFTKVSVLAFFHDHGLDLFSLFDEAAHGTYHDPLEMTVRAEEPPKVEVTVELDGDRLSVTINDEARVVDVTEEGGESA